MADYDVIVIGSGCGGLTAGGILAAGGRKVLVLEQADIIGGCCSTFEREGYHFDIGASIVEVLSPLERAFSMMRSDIKDELDLVPCDPIYDYFLSDGTRMQIPLSIEGTRVATEELSTAYAAAWPGFADDMKEFTALAVDTFFVSPVNTLADMARIFASKPALLKFGSLFMDSYQGVLSRRFKNDRVRELSGFQSFYLGLPPELAPGIFSMLAYSEHEGIYYPKGGMIQIPNALRRCGERFGLELRTGTLVDKVLVQNRRAFGVRLAPGDEITCDVLIANNNAKTLYLDMIGEKHLPWLSRVGIKSYEVSMSTPMVYLGIDFAPPLKAHHALVPETFEDLDDYWWNFYKKGRLPEEYFGLLCWPTKSDPGLAPDGNHVLNLILPPGRYELDGTDWDKEKENVVEASIAAFDKKAVPGLADHVKVWEISTPLDFERRLKLPGGAIYGLQQEGTASAMFRPASKSKAIGGLYLAGASTHPGGGVPSVIASGMIAAGLVERYE